VYRIPGEDSQESLISFGWHSPGISETLAVKPKIMDEALAGLIKRWSGLYWIKRIVSDSLFSKPSFWTGENLPLWGSQVWSVCLNLECARL